ncbi:MAG: hypothetical protein IMW89_17700 [Ktedonobacteraceae bacterium]|nr:hypothetical protein [Ktedonobacteraceae bacterium]
MRHERRDEQFDLLLEQLRSNDAQLPKLNEDDAARIAAAEALARLNQVEIPSVVAQRIEDRVRARIQTLHAQRVTQRRGSQRGMIGSGSFFRRRWILALSVIMVIVLLLFAFLGVTSVAASSLPGDPLYRIKQFEQQVALALAHDETSRASLQITQLHGALNDLVSVVNNKRSDAAITAALNVVAQNTEASQQAVKNLPASQQHAVQVQLAGALSKERAVLHRLLPQLDWPQRLAFTHQLGVIGESIPVIEHVTSVARTEHTITLNITGKNFAPGVRPVIDGVQRGSIVQSNTTNVQVVINSSEFSGEEEHSHTIGVLNPDGTAAQVQFKQEEKYGY